MIYRRNTKLAQKALLALFLGLLAFTACSSPVSLQTPTPTLTRTATPVLDTPTPSASPTSTPSPTQALTPTLTPTPTETQPPSPTPTYAILRGEVLMRSNCRYGPGAAYLYKYGLVAGSVLEVIGRNDPGTWILIRAIGGTNPCWLNASLMSVRGDVMSVAPVDPGIIMPWSPYYGPVTGVTAARAGDEVTIRWYGIVLRAGDDSEQIPYLVEAWVCQDGQIVFTPVGSYRTTVTLTDEPGCAEPSRGRVYAAEKHGYTPWMAIPWPAHETPTPSTAD